MLSDNAGRQPDESVSVLSCDYHCAKDQCLDAFKKKVPFAVSLGCIRGHCGCGALDLNNNVYQTFMAEVSRKAEQGLPPLPPSIP